MSQQTPDLHKKPVRIEGKMDSAIRRIELETKTLLRELEPCHTFSELFYFVLRMGSAQTRLLAEINSISKSLTFDEKNVLWSYFDEELYNARTLFTTRVHSWAELGTRGGPSDCFGDEAFRNQCCALEEAVAGINPCELGNFLFRVDKASALPILIENFRHQLEAKTVDSLTAASGVALTVLDFPDLLQRIPDNFLTMLEDFSETNVLNVYWGLAAEAIDTADVFVLPITEASALSQIKTLKYFHHGMLHNRREDLQSAVLELKKRRHFLVPATIPDQLILRATLDLGELPPFPAIANFFVAHTVGDLPRCTTVSQVREMIRSGKPFKRSQYPFSFFPPSAKQQTSDTLAVCIPASPAFYYRDPTEENTRLALSDPVKCMLEYGTNRKCITHEVIVLDNVIKRFEEFEQGLSLQEYLVRLYAPPQFALDKSIDLSRRASHLALQVATRAGLDQATADFVVYYAAAFVVLSVGGKPDADREALTYALIEAIVAIAKKAHHQSAKD